jgi:hypothetical protein
VQVEIIKQKNTSIELRYYEISILNGTKIEVLAQSDGASVVFYPINDPVSTAEIVAVDMCNQRSNATIECTNSTSGG